MITEEFETKVLRFLVEKLGGHKVEIITYEQPPMVGYCLTNKGTFAVRDLIELINGPDDGRPCHMDKFVADLHEATDDAFERDEAITHWLYGDWDEAMAYLKDEDADEPGEHQEVLDAIDVCNSGDDE